MARPKDPRTARRTVHTTTATPEEWDLIRRFGRICRADYDVAKNLLDSVGQTPAQASVQTPPALPDNLKEKISDIIAEVLAEREAEKVLGVGTSTDCISNT